MIMPELPEVETIKNNLQEIKGKKITALNIRRQDIIKQKDFDPEELIDQEVTNIDRRGKYLCLATGNHCHLLVHMGMTGRFFLLDQELSYEDKHLHFVLHLDPGRKILFQDPRRFGGIWFVRETATFFQTMGMEPLSPDFSPEYCLKVMARRKTSIKNILLNQSIIAGIGNIYADEALYAAGIMPDRPGAGLSSREMARLHRAIQEVLRKGIEEKGTTVRDFRDGYNRSGGFQNQLQVYGRKNQPCFRCGQTIGVTKIGGRSSHYCSRCQQ